VLLKDGHETSFNFRESFIPGSFNKLSVAFDEREAQTIRIFVQVFKSRAFGADKSLTENIRLMPANAFDLAVGKAKLKAAAGFAERTDAVSDQFSGSRVHFA
jgi:hypothetical protein